MVVLFSSGVFIITVGAALWQGVAARRAAQRQHIGRQSDEDFSRRGGLGLVY